MTHCNRIGWRVQASALFLVIIGILLSGCGNQTGSRAQEAVPQAESSTSSDNASPDAGVTVKKVLNDIQQHDNYHKKVELLTDGGKRVTITNASGEVVVYKLEYEGRILAVNGAEVTVQVDQGEEKTITIPEQIIVEDDDQLGLNPGVEIEWEVDADGNIQSVELED